VRRILFVERRVEAALGIRIIAGVSSDHASRVKTFQKTRVAIKFAETVVFKDAIINAAT
jgi:hypothetical protein